MNQTMMFRFVCLDWQIHDPVINPSQKMLHELRCHAPIWSPILAHPPLANCHKSHDPQQGARGVAQSLMILSFAPVACRSHRGICSSTRPHSIATGSLELSNDVPLLVSRMTGPMHLRLCKHLHRHSTVTVIKQRKGSQGWNRRLDANKICQRQHHSNLSHLWLNAVSELRLQKRHQDLRTQCKPAAACPSRSVDQKVSEAACERCTHCTRRGTLRCLPLVP